MKKIFGLLLVAMMLISPLIINAVTADDEEINLKDYKTLNLREILAQEGIKEEFKNYSENSDQVTIYLFRGNGCHYCQNFLNFLNSNADELGKYFKLVGFEVWYDQANSELLGKVSKFLGEDAGGVPYIIIGDKVYGGFADSYADDIKSTIKALYESKDRYDVFEAYNEAVSDAKHAEYVKTVRPTIFNFVFVAVGIFVVCFYLNKKNNELLKALNTNDKEVNVVRQDFKSVKTNKKVVSKKRK